MYCCKSLINFTFFQLATLYLELWKRHSSALTHRWGLATFDLAAEPPRPGYLVSVSSKYKKFIKEKVNVITKMTEPYVPFWKIRIPNMVLSFSVVLLLVCIQLLEFKKNKKMKCMNKTKIYY